MRLYAHVVCILFSGVNIFVGVNIWLFVIVGVHMIHLPFEGRGGRFSIADDAAGVL